MLRVAQDSSSSSSETCGSHKVGHCCVTLNVSISNERRARRKEAARNKPDNDQRQQRLSPVGLPACSAASGSDRGAQETPGPSHVTVTGPPRPPGCRGPTGKVTGLRDPRLTTVGLESEAERCHHGRPGEQPWSSEQCASVQSVTQAHLSGTFFG